MKNFDSARINDNATGASNARANEYAGARAEAYGAMSDLGKRGDRSQGYPMPKLELGEENKERGGNFDAESKKGGKGDQDFSPKKQGGKDGGMRDDFDGENGKKQGGKDGDMKDEFDGPKAEQDSENDKESENEKDSENEEDSDHDKDEGDEAGDQGDHQADNSDDHDGEHGDEGDDGDDGDESQASGESPQLRDANAQGSQSNESTRSRSEAA